MSTVLLYKGYRIVSNPYELESGQFSPNGHIEEDIGSHISIEGFVLEKTSVCNSEQDADTIFINSAKKYIDKKT